MQEILNSSSPPNIKSYKVQKCLSSNYLLGISMFYMMLPMVKGLLLYKIISIGPFMSSAGVFLGPLVYCISNVTTEVYGYEIARNMMWWFTMASITFVTLCAFLIKIPSPETFAHQEAYDLIFQAMPLICFAGTIATVFGLSFNSYLLSKLKIKLQGKAYWLRSLISTCPGEIIYNLIAFPIMYIGKVPFNDFIHIFISVSCFKICATLLLTPFEWILADFLKSKEGINTLDLNVNYNIFRLKIDKTSPDLKIIG